MNPGALSYAFLTIAKVRLLSALLLILTPQLVHAGSATWKTNPTSNDWTNAANWTPRTIPNGPQDKATFGISDTTDVSLSATQQVVDRIIFSPGASSFTITTGVASQTTLYLMGAGITNNSEITQNFVTSWPYTQGLIFYNQATAGSQTVFTAENASKIVFFDETTAGSGTFIVKGDYEDGTSELLFYDNSTAANANVINTSENGVDGGSTVFFGNSTAANGTFTNLAATNPYTYTGGSTGFVDDSTAADGIFTNEGGAASGESGGTTSFAVNSTAGNATISCTGAGVAGAYPGEIEFYGTSSAGSARLIAGGGLAGGDGGTVLFFDTSNGGEAQVELSGNGTLDISSVTSGDLAIGSLSGNGSVLVGGNSISIGSNNLTTTFRGVIQGSGAVTKVGSGTLALAGADTYTGGTTVSGGFLRVDNRIGSATGTGVVQLNGGTLGGAGTLSGAVTVGSGSGTGAFLAPGTGATTLTLQSSLTLKADGAYNWRVRTTSANADKVITNGVTIEGGAHFKLVAKGNAQLPAGTVFVAISNTAATPIAGTFSNLPDGSTVIVGRNTFQADYEGGDGNDLALTVVQ